MCNSKIKDGFLGQKMIILPESIKKKLSENIICEPFYITDLGFYPNAQHHFRARKKGAKQYIFIYCIEGKGIIKINEKTIIVKPNSYHIIHKNTPHEYKSKENEPWSIYWIHFTGTLANALYKRYLELKDSEGNVAFESSRVNVFSELFLMYKNEYTAPKLEFANILGLRFISTFIYNTKEFLAETTINHNNIVNSVIVFLNANLDKTYKSIEIAEKFNCSPSYLFNLFKKKTGYSLIHFFNLKKIQKACEYLKYTDLSIKEISYKVGIQDPLYFSRTFKKHFGLSPKDYRKEQK